MVSDASAVLCNNLSPNEHHNEVREILVRVFVRSIPLVWVNDVCKSGVYIDLYLDSALSFRTLSA